MSAVKFRIRSRSRSPVHPLAAAAPRHRRLRSRRCFRSRPDPASGKIIATFPKPDAERCLGALSSTSASSRRGLARRRSGSTGQRRRAAGSSSSGASARRSRPRSRTPNSSPAPAPPTSRKRCASPSQPRRSGWATSSIPRPDGSFTVDLAGFLARDDFDIPQAIKQGGGGDFKFVAGPQRSRPEFRESLPAQRRVRGAADLPLGRADSRRSATSSPTG